MLDQKIFGEKLRKHRKHLGYTQEEVAMKIGVSPQAISKWKSGDCLPDCFNLKAISDVYNISADVLIETNANGDINAVSSKIEQLATECVWAKSDCNIYTENIHSELGDDLWQMWKSIYFVECCNKKIQSESKSRGNTRIIGSYGTKIWDDDGVACVIKSSLIKNLDVCSPVAQDVMLEICSKDGQKLIIALDCQKPTPKEIILSETGIELSRLNELLLLFTENGIIEFVNDNRYADTIGYKISGKCGIVAYMVLSAMHIISKRMFELSEYFFHGEK